MANTEPSSYGEAFADVYDDWYGSVTDADATAARITSLDPSNTVLELGVGTGRLALPLANAGRHVVGLDASPAMFERLATNDPSGLVEPVLADMANFDLGRTFDVVFVAFNTLFNLTSHEAQRSCLLAVARHLADGGHFLVEAIVPDLNPDTPDRGLTTRHLPDGGVVLNATINNSGAQQMNGQHLHVSPDGTIRLRPWQIRYLDPDQLDQLAAECGLVLLERHEDWDQTPFTPTSTRHVSMYGSRPVVA